MATLQAGQTLGVYRIVRLLGAGGFGAVYEARQAPLDRQVALKVLHRELLQHREVMARFFNEAKALSRLVHPSIVQVSDFGHAPDGTAYLVMEYLHGQSLSSRLGQLAARGQRMPVQSVLQVGFQLADVLSVAHAQGVIHRDLKPDNLMLVADALVPEGERVKVLDFGIAKLTDEGERPGALRTATQAVMGSPSYMSPEQCAGAGRVDARTDVYALGCILYAMLTGRPPFVGEGIGEILGQHQFKDPLPVQELAPKVPTALAALVHRLLTKDKTQRPWMNEAANELGTLLSKQTGGGPVVRSKVAEGAGVEAAHSSGGTIQLSTLGQSLGQKQGSTPLWRRTKRAVGVLVGAVSLAGVVLWTLRTVPAPTPSAQVQKPVVALAGAAFPLAVPPPLPVAVPPSSVVSPSSQPVSPPLVPVVWSLDSLPGGATVLDAQGRSLGLTPLRVERPPGTGIAVLRLRKPGYAETPLSLPQDTDQTHQLRLRPLPPPAASPPLVPKPPVLRAPTQKKPTQDDLPFPFEK